MEFSNACRQLKAWINQSNGAPLALAIGEAYGFAPIKGYSEEEIRTFEDVWHIRFPQDYREFLLTVGACECFIQRGAGFIFLPLSDIPAYNAQLFEGRESSFPRLFVTIALVRRGECAGFDMSREPAVNFTVFIPDIDPDEWLSESSGWGRFADWLTRLIASEGEEIFPW